MPNVGPMELLIVGIIALIVLGPKRLPEVGRSLGKGMREFKDSMAGLTDDDEEEARKHERDERERDEQERERDEHPATHA